MTQSSVVPRNQVSSAHRFWQSDFARSIARRCNGAPDVQHMLGARPGNLGALVKGAVPAAQAPGRNKLARIHKLAVAAWLGRVHRGRMHRGRVQEQGPGTVGVGAKPSHGRLAPPRQFPVRAGLEDSGHEGEAS